MVLTVIFIISMDEKDEEERAAMGVRRVGTDAERATTAVVCVAKRNEGGAAGVAAAGASYHSVAPGSTIRCVRLLPKKIRETIGASDSPYFGARTAVILDRCCFCVAATARPPPSLPASPPPFQPSPPHLVKFPI
jgi:hypothetical protein